MYRVDKFQYSIVYIPMAMATMLITPCTCARGKVIGCVVVVVVVVVVSTKIAISRDVGISATREHNESIEFGEKLASVCVKSTDMVHGHHK